jgi:16S rRNA (adenine1518-N6/adenine1519-N6)-dimethyltransferase
MAERIARAACVEGELVVEIGPGKGILTRQLAVLAKQIIAVEIDARLAARLEDLKIPRVEVRHLDFLKLDLDAFDQPVVVGNIPYRISSLIIEKLIASKNSVMGAVLTVQKEYGAKMTAALGQRGYGQLSICANYHFDIRKLFAIPARYFSPSPEVSSVVIALKPKKGMFNGIDEEEFFRFVSGVFRYRRKSLKNAIQSHLRRLPHGMDHEILSKRPHELGINDLYRVFNMIAGRH